MVQDLRQIIRDILAEELAAHGVKPAASRRPGVREERVSIRSDQDLARFVQRLMSMAGDGRSREEIASGRLVFRLDGTGGNGALPGVGDSRAAAGATQDFAGGLITENHIHRLPDDVGKVRLGPGAVLTPLAKDALRQSGIKTERVKK